MSNNYDIDTIEEFKEHLQSGLVIKKLMQITTMKQKKTIYS